MALAIAQARKAYEAGEVPVGAVMVKDGKIIASAHNECTHVATGHAEMLAIAAASMALGSRYLCGCTIYVTLEPCPMCAYALSIARVSKIIFGAYDPRGGGIEHGPRIFYNGYCTHIPEIIGGVAEHDCGEILSKFFQEIRKNYRY